MIKGIPCNAPPPGSAWENGGFETARRGGCGSLKAFWEQIQKREKMAAEIADDIFPVDFHIYEIKCPENCGLLP